MKIFIDLDGTLTELQKRHYEVYSRCARQFKGQLIGVDEYWHDKRANVSWHDLLTKSNIDPEQESVFLSEFAKLMESPEMLRFDSLLPSARDTLESLSKTNELVLVSLRRNRENLIRQLDELDIARYFLTIVSGHSETKEDVLKKKADLISSLGDYVGAIIIGDTEADISVGKHLGIKTVAVLSGMRDKEFLSAFNPDYIIDSIADISTVLE